MSYAKAEVISEKFLFATGSWKYIIFSTSILKHHPQIFFHRFVTVLVVLLPWYFVEGESQIAPVEQIDYFRKQNLGW